MPELSKNEVLASDITDALTQLLSIGENQKKPVQEAILKVLSESQSIS